MSFLLVETVSIFLPYLSQMIFNLYIYCAAENISYGAYIVAKKYGRLTFDRSPDVSTTNAIETFLVRYTVILSMVPTGVLNFAVVVGYSVVAANTASKSVSLLYSSDFCVKYMSRDMRFPSMWCVRPVKPQINLRIRAV